ncbi:MAG: OmpA family protein [Chlorobi bacterium]|nr:OmpA family protein [Chlorobiota bacterium]
MYKIILLLHLLILTFSGFAQNQIFNTSSKKAIQYYNQAIYEYNKFNYEDALKKLDAATKKDSNFTESFLLKAQIYESLKNYKNEILNYNKAFNIDSACYPYGYYYLAVAQLNSGLYKDAKNNFNKYLNLKLQDSKFTKAVNKYIKQCNFAISAIKNPVPFNPKNLGDSINSSLDEYWPSLSADESVMIFTRLLPRSNNSNMQKVSLKTHHEDLYISYKKDSIWQKAHNMGPIINTRGNEGTQSISVDGQYYFFTACDRPDSFGGCDIYYTERKNNSWSTPVNVGSPINSKFKETQPSISADGQTLYFVSNRPGGKGKLDIWQCTMGNNGYWQKPVNLGDSINTSKNDGSPFIHADGETLYFSSEGHMGLGKADLYMAKKANNNKWHSVKNLGYPINTFNDEQGLYIVPNGKKAYFSSNRENGKGRDIYVFKLFNKIQPNPVMYVKGEISDALTGKKLIAKVELINLKTNKSIAKVISDNNNGTYLVCLPLGYNYALNISKRGYLFHSENFSLLNITTAQEPIVLNVKLQPIQIGSKVILKNIFFEIDSYELKEESTNELQILIAFLQQNPDVKIEIGGHTDNTGTELHNMELSTQRAKTVYDYLKANSIDSSKITFKGYGSKQRIDTNSTIEGRANNRRTEFKIVDK